MKHRLVNNGLGANAPTLLNNQGKLNNEFADDALKEYFSETGADFQVTEESVSIGIEPTYEGDPLKIISVNKDKAKSSITTGQAFGPYGSGIRSTTKTYAEYTNECKFVKFVDKWHGVLFP